MTSPGKNGASGEKGGEEKVGGELRAPMGDSDPRDEMDDGDPSGETDGEQKMGDPPDGEGERSRRRRAVIRSAIRAGRGCWP